MQIGDQITKQNAKKKIKALAKEASGQYSNAIALRAVVQLLPYIGGTIDTFLAWKGEEIREKRFFEHINRLQDELEKLNDTKIDSEYIETDEFLELFLSVTQKVINSSNEQKRRLFCNILLNSIYMEKSQSPLKFSFLDILQSLSSQHIIILRYAMTLNPKDNKNAIEPQLVSKAIKGVNSREAEILLGDLERLRLIERYGVGTWSGGGGWLGIGTFGSNFIEFVTHPN